MEIFTPTEAARNAGTKYRSILVAARFARYLNEFPKDRQVQWAENERAMKLTTLSMRKLVSGELNFRELQRHRSAAWAHGFSSMGLAHSGDCHNHRMHEVLPVQRPYEHGPRRRQ